MPLFVCDSAIASEDVLSLSTFFKTITRLKESPSLAETSIESVGPAGLVYVDQREYAVVSPSDDDISVIGSEDATTCHIVVVRHSGSGVAALAHIDSTEVEEDVKRVVDDVRLLSDGTHGELELHLVGGFTDDRGFSQDISLALLGIFHNMDETFHLKTACITDLNTAVKENENWPIVYGVAYHVKEGKLLPASFVDKGPDMPLRGARHFTGTNELVKIYDSKEKLLTIGPFNYEALSYAPYIRQQSDEFIRQNMSTSPAVEPPHFANRVRQTMKQLMDHPHPMQSVFKNNRPRQYRKSTDGSWTLLSDTENS